MSRLSVRSETLKNKNMQAVKNAGSQIEVTLGRALWAAGLRYRKNNRKVFGKPDFTLKKHKIAVFADSEFWHGKDWEVHKHDHKSNIEFWHRKIERNMERDREVKNTLEREGWIVIRFWGTDIKKNPAGCANEVIKAIGTRNAKGNL